MYAPIALDAATLLLARTAPTVLDAVHDDDVTTPEALTRRIEDATNADGAARRVLRNVATHAATCVSSNAARAHRYCLALALDPAVMEPAAGPSAPTPFGVIFVHGRRFDGFHVRFRPIARGGARLVTPRSAEALAHESARHYDECFNLAFAQQLKNKDILEGGSKGVVLINATPASGADSAWAAKGGDAFHDYLCRKSTKAYTDGVLDLCVDDDGDDGDEGGTTRGTQKRDTLPMVYLGPDEQIVPKDINWVVANAARRGHPTPDAFMSSKQGSKRVIQRRFDVGVLEATPGRTTLRVRPER